MFVFGCAIQLARSLVPQPAIEPAPLAVKTRSPNQWTKREFPEPFFTASSKQKNLSSPAESSHISHHPPLLKILPTSCYPKNQVLSSEWDRGTEGQRQPVPTRGHSGRGSDTQEGRRVGGGGHHSSLKAGIASPSCVSASSSVERE